MQQLFLALFLCYLCQPLFKQLAALAADFGTVLVPHSPTATSRELQAWSKVQPLQPKKPGSRRVFPFPKMIPLESYKEALNFLQVSANLLPQMHPYCLHSADTLSSFCEMQPHALPGSLLLILVCTKETGWSSRCLVKMLFKHLSLHTQCIQNTTLFVSILKPLHSTIS